MKITIKTYKQDNGCFGTTTTIRRKGFAALVFVDKANASTETKAFERTLNDGIVTRLLQ